MMKIEVVIITSHLLLASCLLRALAEGTSGAQNRLEHASFPPRGWNSYDSFCWTISEEEFLKSAEIVSQRLHSHGYEYVVVDYLWYRRKVEGAYVDSLGFDVIDEWGRMMPDPGRWPSSKGGIGFTEVAKKVHDMGLKFGIHVMRGISTQAVNANTPILDTIRGRTYEDSGRLWRAKDIALTEKACAWMQHGFMSVNTKLEAGRAFLRSLYAQYAEWGVDFVKHDCVFGEDFDIEEITYVSEVLRKLDRPILYSLSPGTSVTPAMAKDVSGLVNMYRITGDDWDKWTDVASHFDVARDFSAASMIGSSGLKGKSWPDLDMLPLGWLTDQGLNEGPHRTCNLTLDEQRSQMTLWSMAKSPLMFGGDVRRLDDTTYNLITHPTLLEINSFSSSNMEFPYITSIENSYHSNEVHYHRWTRVLKDTTSSNTGLLSVSDCSNLKSRAWSVQGHVGAFERVCWKGNSRKEFVTPFCLFKRKLFSKLDDEITYQQQYQGKFHLLAAETENFCLEASAKRKVTLKKLKGSSFSTCKLNANQMWHLSPNGTVISSYSGLCLTVKEVKANVIGGIRSWIATGRRGEVYVAFFNLNPKTTVISTKVSDLAKALQRSDVKQGSCTCKEVWSGRDFGLLKRSLFMEVQTHGCALFVLNC